ADHNQDGNCSHESRRCDDSQPANDDDNDDDGDNDDDDGDNGVWMGFERSVTYLKQVAVIYRESFGGSSSDVAAASGIHRVATSGAHDSGSRNTVPRTKITKTRLLEAQQQAREALELLASNLLNASTAIAGSLEAQ
ncbi:hypothetical protein PybrP1_007515, partial [[Pythium] brassicae (nom. inval.)]